MTAKSPTMRSFVGTAIALLVMVAAVPALPADADPAGEPGGTGTLYVTERTPNSSTVSALDASTGHVLWTSPTGSVPIGVTQPHGTGRVYTSDEGAARMSVFDERTGAFVRSIPLGSRPHHLMASANGNFIYVAEFGQNTIGVVDTTTDVETARFVASASPAALTHAVWISNDGTNLYATNSVANTVAKLDAGTGERQWEFGIGENPSEILVTQNDQIAYVSVRNEDKIKVLDVSGTTPLLIGQAVVQSQPDTLSLTNDGSTLVVGLRASPTGRARAALVDVATLTTRYVEMPTHTTTGHQWLSANGKLTFMAVETPGAVAVIDNGEGQLVGEYPYPGGSRVHGVFLRPGPRR